MSIEHRAEQYYSLFEENKRLKVYQDKLNKDLEIMNSKLKYITSKINKRNQLTGEEFIVESELIEQNATLRNENKKLKEIVKGLKSGALGGKSDSKRMDVGYDQVGEAQMMVSKMKDRLKENLKVIDDLKTENELLRRGNFEKASDSQMMEELKRRD